MYVNDYKREFMNEGDNSPIGIILCSGKNQSVVKTYFCFKISNMFTNSGGATEWIQKSLLGIID